MPPKLVLHIGHHKTGSSSIQQALARDEIALPGRSVLYPCRVSHNYLRRHVEAFVKSGAILADMEGMPNLEGLEQAIAKARQDYVVISGEEFESIAPGPVRQAMARFVLPHVSEHRVLCYVRPHAGRMLSSFAEKIKIGQALDTPEAYHRLSRKRGRFIYAPRLAKWQAVWGDALVLRVMQRDLLERGSVVDDFVVQAFGADAAGAQLRTGEAANETLSLEELMVLKVVQRRIRRHGKAVSLMLGWELARLFADGEIRQRRTKPQLHRALAEEVRRDYLEDARELDRGVFAAAPVFEAALDQAVDTALPEAQSWKPRDHLRRDTMITLQAMTRLVDEMLENKRGKWPPFLRETRYAAVLAKAAKEGGG